MKPSTNHSLAAALLAVLLLSSCGESATPENPEKEQEGSVTETPAVTEETTAIPPSPVEGEDYGGSDLRIITNICDGVAYALNEFAVESEHGEHLNDAIFARNEYIAEKYNIVFSVSNDDIDFKNVDKTVNADEDAYDLLFPGITKAFNWGVQGYLYEVGSIPELHPRAEYWNEYILSETSVAHKNYFLLGDMNLLAYDSTAAMFYNKNTAQKYDLEAPYDLVRSGRWTFDKMMELCAAVSDDVNGDGIYGAEDMYGLGINSYGALCMTYGAGACFAPKNTNDLPELTLTESTTEFFQKLINNLTTGNLIMYGERFGVDRVTALQKAFQENRMLFYNEMLNRTAILRDMDTDFGVLPLPKKDEAQKDYVSFIHQGNSSVVCVPVTVQDIGRVGKILEDIAYESHYYLYPVYLETTVKGKYLRDKDSEEMVDILLHGIRYDLAFVSGSQLIGDLRTLLTDGNQNVTSEFEKNRASYEQTLSKLIDAIVSAED